MLTKLITLTAFFLIGFLPAGYSQEKFGNTLNLGLGVGGYGGYYRYAGRSLPVFHLNYELGVARNFTLAPFISIYTFSTDYNWGNNNTPNRFYSYRETVVPIGVKGTYYFDELLEATSPWDFYLAASIGVAIVRSRWEEGYAGDRDYYHSGVPVLFDFHIGAEYHFNNNIGAFLDLSSGISTIGIAIH